MSNQFPTLFSPCKIGNVEIKNRICKAPQTTGLSHMDGTVSERLVRCYEDLAKGEVGMIIVEYAYVDRKFSKSCSALFTSVCILRTCSAIFIPFADLRSASESA